MKKLTGALLNFDCVVDLTGRQCNLASAMARGLPVCTEQPERTGALAIVGSGPSVREYIQELRRWPGAIWAINGAYDFLLGNDITPAGFVAVGGMTPMTFTNGATVTGTRYSVTNNGVVFTNGGGATYLPGNAAGSSANGGQYL